MVQQLVPSTEGHPARAAGKRPLARVDSRVSLHDVLVAEALPTRVAEVSLSLSASREAGLWTKRFSAGAVGFLVVDRFLTNAAPQLAFVHVGAHVSDQLGSNLKGFLTKATPKRLRARLSRRARHQREVRVYIVFTCTFASFVRFLLRCKHGERLVRSPTLARPSDTELSPSSQLGVGKSPFVSSCASSFHSSCSSLICGGSGSSSTPVRVLSWPQSSWSVGAFSSTQSRWRGRSVATKRQSN